MQSVVHMKSVPDCLESVWESLGTVAQECARSFNFFYQTPSPLNSRNGGAHLGSSSLTRVKNLVEIGEVQCYFSPPETGGTGGIVPLVFWRNKKFPRF